MMFGRIDRIMMVMIKRFRFFFMMGRLLKK